MRTWKRHTKVLATSLKLSRPLLGYFGYHTDNSPGNELLKWTMYSAKKCSLMLDVRCCGDNFKTFSTHKNDTEGGYVCAYQRTSKHTFKTRKKNEKDTLLTFSKHRNHCSELSLHSLFHWFTETLAAVLNQKSPNFSKYLLLACAQLHTSNIAYLVQMSNSQLYVPVT